MMKPRLLIFIVLVAHWVVAIWHLFLAAQILPAPNDQVSWVAIAFITLGHAVVAFVVWKLSERVTGWVSLVFFLAALGADLYEHFLHASLNNIFMVTPGDWTTVFRVSVFVRLGLEIAGCALGMRLASGGARNSRRTSIAGHGAVS